MTGQMMAVYLVILKSIVLHYLVGDIDPFAVHYRRESIDKGPTIVENPAGIARRLKKLLAQLKDESVLKHTAEQNFLSRIANYFAELNYLHPFREGNGRATTRVCSSALSCK